MKLRLTQMPRRYHTQVWGHCLKAHLFSAYFTLVFAVMAVVFPFHALWGVVFFTLFAVVEAAKFGNTLGRHYQQLDDHMARQFAWHQMQQELRTKLMEDHHLTEEEADQFLWQMDLEIDQMSRGESKEG